MQGMIGKDNLMKAERRLHAAESDADQCRAANMKLTLKLDELRSKYNIPGEENWKYFSLSLYHPQRYTDQEHWLCDTV